MAPLGFDASNLSLYPWVSVCITQFFYIWLFPTLWATSKTFQSALERERILSLLKPALKVHACKTIFLKKLEEAKLRACLVKHLWLLWNKPSGAMWVHVGHSMTQALSVLLTGYQKNPSKTVTGVQARQFGLAQNTWAELLRVLVRLACLMHYYGLSNSKLYMLFTARMDLAIRAMQGRYPYAIKGRLSFSKAIEELVASPSFDLWVWNISCYPVNCTMLCPLYRVWEHSASALNLRLLTSLPASIQTSVLLIACYSRMHKCKFIELRGQCLVSYERMLQHVGAEPSMVV
jgi:hypothetical protein